MKVTIVCPWWRRWEVTLIHCQSMKRFIKESPGWVEVNYVAIVSKEDSDYTELVDIAHSFRFTVCQFSNKLLGQKLNAGINTALSLFKPDYIMNMGSDDLCDAMIWDEYRSYLDEGVQMIGIDSCHIVDQETQKAYYLDVYNNKYPVGVLRMIKATTIERLRKKYKLSLYHHNLVRGMDTASMNRLRKIGVEPVIIRTGGRPFTAGFKCNVAINHFQFLSSIPQANLVDINILKNLLK